VITVAHDVRRQLREAVFLDIRPSLMREYRPQNGNHLGTAGENISPVLAALPESQREDIIGWLAELCAPEVQGLEFDVTQLREVMMMIVEKGGRKTSARSASDGTLKFLGVVVALLTAPAGSLLVLEEPDVGLHPSRIRLLVELFEYATQQRKVQIIATTHSSPMLAQLKPETLADVIAFARDPETGDTRCSRVGDLEYFSQLRDSKDSEHLLSTGWLERAL
jgi:predicted ATPase